MPDKPLITAEITFLRTEEDGRREMPAFNTAGRYMPHLVVQDRDVRSATKDIGRPAREQYQGVAFVDGPDACRLGDTGRFVLELMYYPEHRYEDLQPGTAFTVREGARIVAHGVVTSRNDPDAA